MRTFFLSCLLVSFLIIPFRIVNADTILFFAPTRIDLSDENPIGEIRLSNTSDITRSYSIALRDFIMTEEGVTALVENFDYSARRMVRYVPRQFELAPGGKQIVRIMARFPPGTEDGTFHSHLEFLEDVSRRNELNQTDGQKSRARMMAQIAYSTAIPVTITKGVISTTLDIVDARLDRDDQGKPVILMGITRSGNGQGNVFLEADYIAPDGTITKAATRRTIYVYREIDERKHSLLLELLDETLFQKGGAIQLRLFNRDVSENDPVKELTIPIS